MTVPQHPRTALRRKSPAHPQPISNDPSAGQMHGTSRNPSKLDLIRSLLIQPGGTTLEELVAATGWQPHSVRAGLTSLRKRGLTIDRAKGGGISRFSANAMATAEVARTSPQAAD